VSSSAQEKSDWTGVPSGFFLMLNVTSGVPVFAESIGRCRTTDSATGHANLLGQEIDSVILGDEEVLHFGSAARGSWTEGICRPHPGPGRDRVMDRDRRDGSARAVVAAWSAWSGRASALAECRAARWTVAPSPRSRASSRAPVRLRTWQHGCAAATPWPRPEEQLFQIKIRFRRCAHYSFAAMAREEQNIHAGKMERKHEDALAGLQAQPRISSAVQRPGF